MKTITGTRLTKGSFLVFIYLLSCWPSASASESELLSTTSTIIEESTEPEPLCKPLEYPDSVNGTCTCLPKGRWGAKCHDDFQCRSDLHYKCSNGRTCSCDGDTSTYSTLTESCVGLAETNCINGKCVENGQCHPQYPQGLELHRVQSSTSRCKCNSGTVASPEGLCLVPFQGTCEYNHNGSSSSNCLKTLVCRQGICLCANEAYQYYNSTEKECITYVGGPCRLNNSLVTSGRSTPASRCISNAVCTGTREYQTYESEFRSAKRTCKCSNGFVPNADRECELGFGIACTKNGLSCGRSQGLLCTDGYCSCQNDLLIFDDKTSECRGLVGALCSEKGAPCIDGAFCQAPKRPWMLGKCTCNNGLSLNGRTMTCHYWGQRYARNGQMILKKNRQSHTIEYVLIIAAFIVLLLN